ncbi:MAG: 50S ribosomal protein L9 [Spirochaetia bacterium]|nr:50S ribosomal protein L9 [Spirochaetia bacterium]
MKIILFEDVPGLGEEGDIVDVKRGYARNYLLPRGFAVICTKSALAVLKERQSAIEKRKAEKREQSRSTKEKIEAMDLKIKVSVGENGKLFGSVSNATLADELLKAGINVERKRIDLPEHAIKAVGHYTAKIRLYEDQTAVLKFSVTDGKEAEAVEAPAEEPAAE